MSTPDNVDGRPVAGGLSAGVTILNETIPVDVVGGSGGGPATIANGADVALGATTDAAVVTNTTGTVIGFLRGLISLIVAKITVIIGDGANNVTVQTDNADGVSNTQNNLTTTSRLMSFNSATWERQRNNHEVTALASAARAASVNSADLTNYNARGIIVVIDVTALEVTGQLTVTLQGKDTLSGKYYTLIVSAAIVAVGTTVLRVYPGSTTVANLVADSAVPRVWRVSAVALNGVSITYSASVNFCS